MLAILLIPAALCYTFGAMVRRHAPGLGGARRDDDRVRRAARRVRVAPSSSGNPLLAQLGVDQTASAAQAGGNMEGKEARFGIANSALWATATTAASNGSVNSMHDSFTPLGGLVPMWLMQLGEVIFGGVGSGLYGMLVFAIIAVFIAGLMIGRTPEYLGKKIEAFEMKMASIAILVPPFAGARRHRDRGAWPTPARPASPTRARTASPRSSTRSRRPATTTAAPSPASRPTRRSTTPMLGIAMWFARFWLIDSGARASPARSPRRRRVPAATGHAADAHAAVRRAADRHRAARRRAHLRAGAGARARSSSTCMLVCRALTQDDIMTPQAPSAASIPTLARPGDRRVVQQARPARTSGATR